MLQVLRDHLEKTWHELDTEKQLCLAIETPREQVNERHEPISLNHVIAVLSQTAKLG